MLTPTLCSLALTFCLAFVLCSKSIVVQCKFLIHHEGIPHYKPATVLPRRVALLFEIDTEDQIDLIPRILEILRQNSIKGTFFFNSKTIHFRSRYLSTIKKAGQQVGYKTSKIDNIIKECESACKKLRCKTILVPREFIHFPTYKELYDKEYNVIACFHTKFVPRIGKGKKFIISYPLDRLDHLAEEAVQTEMERFVFASLCDYFDCVPSLYDIEKWNPDSPLPKPFNTEWE